MDAPRIQYATTSDGVSIAFWTLGEGDPFVHMPSLPFSHIHAEWRIPECRRWYQRLADKRRLVRYDVRGFGLSDRDVTDFSLEAQMRDLEAVADPLGLQQFALFASGDSGMTAIAYAAQHPQRVSHLILWCTWARRSDVSASPRTQSLRALLDQDWEIYTETVARVLLGWSSEEEARRLAAFYRECATPEVTRAAVRAVYDFDVTPLLAQVKCPTLVLHRRQIPSVDLKVIRDLASRIPGARLALLEGTSPLPFTADVDSVLAAIHEFLGDEAGSEMESELPQTQAPVTILFTDMETSTALTQRLGDAKAQELVRAHNTIVRDALKAHRGREIKHTGDGIMASFASATQALECAVAIQRAVEERNRDVGAHGHAPLDHRGRTTTLPAHPEALEGRAEPHPSAHASRASARADSGVDASTEPIAVRIGLNAGEPIAEEKDLFGTAVQLAARIRDLAQPRQILASDVVRQLAAGKGFLFADQGETVLRGFEDPVRIYEVRWWEDAVS